MSTKTVLTIILSLVLVAFVGAGWFFLTGNNSDTTGTDSGGSSGFSPFGIFGGGDNNKNADSETGGVGQIGEDSANTGGNEPGSNQQKTYKLLKLVDRPTAGFIVFNKGSSTIIRYTEKENGHIQEINTTTLEKRRLSNTTVPKIHEAIFSGKGEQVIFRYLNEEDNIIQTFSAKILISATSSDEGTLSGSFLDESINQLSVSPDRSKIFTLINYGNSSVGTVSLFDGTKKSQIFESSFTEWIPQWATPEIISLVTKPSSSVFGFNYSITTKNPSLVKIDGKKYGLTSLMSGDGKKIIFSENTENGLMLSVLLQKTKTVYHLGLSTFSEKCVWSQDNITAYCAVPESIPRTSSGYPDSWYQGLVSFSDTIWKIDTESGSTDQLTNLREASRERVDVISPQLNQDGTKLFFINKIDNSVWVLSL
jgi:hypothetical protein